MPVPGPGKKWVPPVKASDEESHDDLDDFLELIGDSSEPKQGNRLKALLNSPTYERDSDTDGKEGKTMVGGPVQYSLFGTGYVPTTKTVKTLPPGAYHTRFSQAVGIYLDRANVVTDELIEFPDTQSEKIIAEIDLFWTLKEKFSSMGFSHKRGILLWGPPGCHAKGTGIVMYDGSVKQVEDIRVGDRLMGPDSKPRTVLGLCRGREKMFRITPSKGPALVVNESHILSLKRSHLADTRYPSTVNTSVKEFMNLSKCSQRSFKLYHSPAVDFDSGHHLPIDPYVFGAWLGDGTSAGPSLTTMDQEIENAWRQEAERLGISNIRVDGKGPRNKAFTYSMTNGMGQKNPMLDALRELNVLDNKHIPEQYLKASPSVRLQVLAGMIDTDGSYAEVKWRANEKFRIGNPWQRNFTFVQKSTVVTEGFCFLARSLGFSVSVRRVTKTIKSTGFSGTYYSVCLGGEIWKIPTRLERKKVTPGTPNKNPSYIGIRSIEELPEDDFFGFTLSGDHLYMTDDFIVHHNSGKSCTIALVMKKMIERNGLIIIADSPQLLSGALASLRSVEPNRPVVVIWEDVDAVIRQYGESEVLAILDGESQVDNIMFIATTNYPENLDARITNRPSRFDQIQKISMPSAEARAIYLKAKTKTTFSPDGVDLVAESEGFSIAHLRELVVAIWCLGSPTQEVIKRLHKMKVKPNSESSNGPVGFGS